MSSPYRLRIYRDGRLYVKGWLPETFSFNLTSQWDSPFANMLANRLGALGQGAGYVGLSARAQFLTVQAWQGSSPVQFNIPLHLWARNDAREDVSQIVQKLGELVLPSKLGGMFIPPASIGGSIARSLASGVARLAPGVAPIQDGAAIGAAAGIAAGGGDADAIGDAIGRDESYGGFITLQIGEFLEIPDLICTSIVPQFFSRMDKTHKNPIEATVDITFETLYTPAVEDFKEWFNVGNGGGIRGAVLRQLVQDIPPENVVDPPPTG